MAHKSNLLVSSLLACVVLVSCSGADSNNITYPSEVRENSIAYPSEVRENYISSCVTNAESSGYELGTAQDYCECTLEILQKEYSIKEFSDAEQAMLRGEKTGIDFVEIASQCEFLL